VKVGQTNLFSPKNVDWNKTLAFSYGYPTKIYLNPRFKNERVKIIEEIKKELLKIKIPGSELPVVKRIYTKDEIYHGPYIDRAPEIVIELNEPPHYFEIEEKDQKPLLIQYGHRMDGIVLCYGEGIRRGSKINNATIYDVAPTILHMFNVPIPKDMDGRVLKGIFDENSEFYKREVVYSETVGERERIKTKIAKLRALKKF
jgi:predicted AlkP superfamily phosphohydrolase/phosphomutase